MQITRLRVSGFKSFGDPVELLIEQGLTGIVGPNGCGKSNLVEALRWVMGESSARGLRGDEMDDVIFNGSSARAAFDLTEVTLRLRGPLLGSTALAPTAADEIDIARRLSRGTGSVYRIDGDEARARDVQLLFADAGSGSRSASIIGQGQIGFIVDAKPQERRRLLEEAAGIGGLHGRRREAELRLDATDANLARATDRLAELERRAETLAQQAQDAQRYRHLGEDIRETEALLLLGRWDAARHELAAATTGVAEVEEAAAATVAACEQAAAERARLAREVAAVTGRQATLAAELARLGERLAAQREAHRQRRSTREELTRRRAELQADMAREAAAGQELHARLGALRAERDALALTRPEAGAAMARADRAEIEATGAVERLTAALAPSMAAAAAAEAASAAAEDRRRRLQSRQVEMAPLLAAQPEGEKPEDHAAETGESTVAALMAALEVAETKAEAARDRRSELSAQLDGAAQASARAAEAAAAARERHREAVTRAQLAAQRQTAAERERLRLARDVELLATRAARNDAAMRELDLEGIRAAAGAATNAAMAACVARDTLQPEDAMARAREAAGAVAAAREDLAALGAEATALRQLLGGETSARSSVADVLVADATLSVALGAALGDELLAGIEDGGPAFWHDLGPLPDVPSLPPGSRPLAEAMEVPPALARRLSQIGVVAAAEGAGLQPALRPGQRLVSPEGDLWRWDGFVRRGDCETAAASRLRHRHRLSVLQAEIGATEAHLEGLHEAQDAAQQRAEAAIRAGSEADRAEAQLGAARARLATAEAEARRLAGEAASVAAEREELARALERLAGEDHDAAGQASELTTLGAAADSAERLCADTTATLRDLERQRESLDTTLADTERRVHGMRHDLDRRREAADAARVAKAERRAAAQAARASLEAERSALAGELEGLDRDTARLQATLANTRAARGSIEAELAAARSAQAALAREAAQHRQAVATQDAETERVTQLIAELTSRLGPHRARAEEAEARLRRVTAELDAQPADDLASETRSEALAERCAALDGDHAAASAARVDVENALAAVEAELAQLEARRHAAAGSIAVARATLGRAESTLEAAEALVRERLRQTPEALLAAPEVAEALGKRTPDALEQRLHRLQGQRERLGAVNLRAEVEHAEVGATLAAVRGEVDELRSAVERLHRAIARLNREGRERLTEVFDAVDGHFRRLFVRLFGGGRAHLRLTDTEDPFAAGLELDASPPGKRLSSVSLLSGGEKTLTALALVMALFLARPSPLCVLDEVDAPLDDANVDRFIGLIDEIASTAGTRFLVVTHHPLTMSRMHRLFGVTMIERGVSRLVSVALEQAIELRATA